MQNDELRRTQLELEESRDRYLDLYEFAPIGYLTLSRESLILEINLTGALLLGQDRKKVLQRPLSRFISPEDCDRYHRLLGQIVKHDERQSFAVKLNRSDGSIVHVQLDCVRVVNGDARLTIRVTLTDISEQRHAEAEVANLAFLRLSYTAPKSKASAGSAPATIGHILTHSAAWCYSLRRSG